MARVVAVLGSSMAFFWLGLILTFVFFFKFGWFPGPVGRLGIITQPPETVTGFFTVDAALGGEWSLVWEAFRYLALPALTVGFVLSAPIIKIVRSSMIEVLDSEYVRTARAVGVSGRQVLYEDGFRNALVPVTTAIGIVFGYMLGGNIIVELIFAWPGVGRYAYEALRVNTKPSLSVTPSRYVPERPGVARSMGFLTDPSGSLVWIEQDIDMPGLWPDGEGMRSRTRETWVDLFNIDTGEIVLTADILGDWGVAGALEGGLLIRELHNRVFKINRYTIDSTVLEEPGRILILGTDGRKRYVTPALDVTPGLDGPAEGWRQGFAIHKAYGNHFALRMKNSGEILVVDADTGGTHPVPKPGAGFWTPMGLPLINIASYSFTNSDAFVIGFRTAASSGVPDDWSLYEIRLSNQSVRRIYQHPPHDLPTGYYRGKPPLSAKSVANGTAVLAFTGWPVSPDNNAVINLIGPGGEPIPVVGSTGRLLHSRRVLTVGRLIGTRMNRAHRVDFSGGLRWRGGSSSFAGIEKDSHASANGEGEGRVRCQWFTAVTPTTGRASGLKRLSGSRWLL